MKNIIRVVRAVAFCVTGTLFIAVIGAVILTAKFGEEWEEMDDENSNG